MASKRNCGCMGALNCIAGPMYHCPMPPAKPEYYLDFPYYNGPCPPCEGDNCRPDPCCPCHHCGHCHPHGVHPRTRINAGLFTANAPLSTDAGGGVPLVPAQDRSDCFACDGGCIRILKSGVYHVLWTANIPSYQNFSSRICLTLNGKEIAGSSQQICCQADNTSTSVTGQAMVHTPPGGILRLSTDGPLCLTGGCEIENIFTLALHRLE